MVTTRDRLPPASPRTFGRFQDRGRLAIVVLIGFVVLVVVATLAPRAIESDSGAAPAFSGMELTPPRELPALSLDRTDGTAWSSAESEDRISLFFFGYTNCPDVCPLTLSRANQIHQQLGEDAGSIDVYFITVDPERDTPDRLGLYVSQFNPAFTGLTGTPEQLQAAISAFGVVAVKQESLSGAGYSVDHTAGSYLVDDAGRIRLIYPHDAPAADIVRDIQSLLADASGS